MVLLHEHDIMIDDYRDRSKMFVFTANTAISRLDPKTLNIIRTWRAPFSKQLSGNCFMICSKLYCTSNHFSHDAKVRCTLVSSADMWKFWQYQTIIHLQKKLKLAQS